MPQRLEEFLRFAALMRDVEGRDPGAALLRSMGQRWEWTQEQSYWSGLLYAATGSAPLTYYLMHQFPDASLAQLDRLGEWWEQEGGGVCAGLLGKKTDLVGLIGRYRKWIGGKPQSKRLEALWHQNPDKCYQRHLESLGRLTGLNVEAYLKALDRVTGYRLLPPAPALTTAPEISNGVAWVMGYDRWVIGKGSRHPKRALPDLVITSLTQSLGALALEVKARERQRFNYWDFAEALALYDQQKRGQGWIGLSLDRLGEAIETMQQRVPVGVYWEALWEFRRETYPERWLREITNTRLKWGDFSRSRHSDLWDLTHNRPKAPGLGLRR